MPYWPKDAKEFTVSITHNRQRGTSYSYIPKPILRCDSQLADSPQSGGRMSRQDQVLPIPS